MHILTTLTTLAQSSYTYNDSLYTTTTTSSTLTSEQAAVILVLYIFVFILSIAAYVVSALCFMKIFKKAGVKPWIAWVPFYNNWKTLEIGGQQGYWAVLALIPVVNIASAVFMLIAFYNIGLKLGKSGAFVLLAFFLPLVWTIWLAVDKSVWNDAAGAPSRATDATPPTTAAAPVAAAPGAYAQPVQPTTFAPTPAPQPEQPVTPVAPTYDTPAPQAPAAEQPQAEDPNNQQTPPSNPIV